MGMGLAMFAAGAGAGFLSQQEKMRKQKIEDDDVAFKNEERGRVRKQWGREDDDQGVTDLANKAAVDAVASYGGGPQLAPAPDMQGTDILGNAAPQMSRDPQADAPSLVPSQQASGPQSVAAPPAPGLGTPAGSLAPAAAVPVVGKTGKSSMSNQEAPDPRLLAGLQAKTKVFLEHGKLQQYQESWLKTAEMRSQIRAGEIAGADREFQVSQDPSVYVRRLYGLIDDGHQLVDSKTVVGADGKPTVQITRRSEDSGQDETITMPVDRLMKMVETARNPAAMMALEAERAKKTWETNEEIRKKDAEIKATGAQTRATEAGKTLTLADGATALVAKRNPDGTVVRDADGSISYSTVSGGAGKALNQDKLDKITKQAHGLVDDFSKGLTNPYATSPDEKGGDPTYAGALKTFLSQGISAAARNGETIDPSKAIAELRPIINQADMAVRKQAEEQAKLLFEGTSHVFGKNSPDTEKLEALKAQGVPAWALADPTSFKRYYREQKLEAAVTALVRGGPRPAAQAPATQPAAASAPTPRTTPATAAAEPSAPPSLAPEHEVLAAKAKALDSKIADLRRDYNQATSLNGRRGLAEGVAGRIKAQLDAALAEQDTLNSKAEEAYRSADKALVANRGKGASSALNSKYAQ